MLTRSGFPSISRRFPRAQFRAVAKLFLVRLMNAHVARIFVLVLAASYRLVASDETDYGAELKRQVTEDRGPHWLFVSQGHVDLGAEEVRLIGEWIVAHDTGWKPASVLDFSPSKTQFLTANCVIEINGDRIVVTYMRDQKDPDSAVYIQRSISPDEQSFWSRIVAAAQSTNQPVQRTGWPP
jgi:hypothetical protein